ncbi:hypothetical protein PUNSTDRAFT_49408 [Punctularia strigosozonata HHB-11173 SS5]|uniref:uncharacterized protein n=1 Tax=Punctularia strigosozonata (strain HHB-11173) TaxID=741275 RepID=UPI0004416F4E|nr:uncharacterized protein PUNSTDRAFT_49408 [Punctularia strigosozonata HHB-11173 SS5]EIN14724.1 hypothetical protein PUNSTDRAFT_49408 [Punctularia strigosozonata HHB-11173 SS5]
MVDWNSEAEITQDATVFNNLVHACIGLYLWEWATALQFDWDIATGKRRFRWPMIFYLLNRYSMVGVCIGFAIVQNSHSSTLQCTPLYTYIQFVGDASVALPSLNLAIRTMAVWSDNKILTGALVLVILGHWAILFQGLSVTAISVPGTGGCAVTHTNLKISIILFIYTMCFDFVTMLLNAVKLARPRSGHSSLTRLLFTDGLIYFVIAFVANTIATIFMVMNLNAVMSIMFVVPAATASTIVATRAFRRLSNFSQSLNVYSGSGSAPLSSGRVTAPRATGLDTGVHVKMETFAVAEDDSGRQTGFDHEAQSDYKARDF